MSIPKPSPSCPRNRQTTFARPAPPAPHAVGACEVILQTPRLTVRALDPDDAAFVLELVNEPPWLAYIGNKNVRTLDDAADYIRNGPMRMYAGRGFGLWAVGCNDAEEPIGICGLIKRETLDDVDLGFAFLQRFWGRGYAQEAAGATLAYGWNVLALERIVAITAPDNERSSRLLHKLGFRFERHVTSGVAGAELELFAATKSAPVAR